ncbi:histone promoter control protein hip4 [Gigaspora margarita]|uniref:Histone promoter control protein hip4 n=1 Tax=Gigaspora margarita TaxID=4874 RepID=A0A8H4B4Y5_GIGMA|nr:histone promoter control protein hip4 [Gigaspora margarita]
MEVDISDISKEEDVTEKAETSNATESAVSAIESEAQQASTVSKQQNRELVENTEPKTPEKQPEIRLDIPLTSRYNNIVYFPDLLKEAGYAIAKTPPRYMSCSETPGSESPQSEWSDFETPDDFRTPTPPSAVELPRAFRDENDEFFEKILENAEKYAIVEEEKTRKKKRRIIKKEQHYDVNDPFIDDSELAPLQRDYGKVRPQIEGFFVWNGPLVLERLVDEDESLPKKKTPAKRKPKSSETDGPKVRKARTVKKAEGGSDGKGKAAPKKRVSKKLKTAGDTNQESSSMNGEASISRNETNPLHTIDSSSSTHSTNISTIGANNNTSAHQKDLSDPNKSAGKKKKVYPVDPVHPDVQYLLELFKQQVDEESFEVKSRFPQNLKPPLMELLSRAYELNQFNENLFKILTNMLPYNKFTITRLCQRTLYPKALIELQKKKLELIERLKIAVDEIMPSLLQELNERNASVSSSSALVNGDNSAEMDSNMEIDGDVDIEPDADADGDIKSDSKSDSSSNNIRSKETANDKKFRWDENTRFLLWKIVQEEMSWVVMSNCLAEAEEKSERHSEQTRRKSLYQYLLTLWPKGWMTSYEIAQALEDFN